jgi:hypothetical protein
MPWSPVVLPVFDPNIIGPPCDLHKQNHVPVSSGNILKPRLPLVGVPGMFLQHCVYLVDSLEILLLKDLVGDDPREHMAGDVPGQSWKGQYGKREKYTRYDQ